MSFGLEPIPEQQVAEAARFMLEVIDQHGPEIVRLARSRGPEPLLLFREEILRRRDHLLDLGRRSQPGRLRDAVLTFVRAHKAWEVLVWAGSTGRDADRQVEFSGAARNLRNELRSWS